MSHDLIMKIALIFVGILVVAAGILFVWLAFGTKKRKQAISVRQSNKRHIEDAVLSILNAPSSHSMQEELEDLKDFVGNSIENFDFLSDTMFKQVQVIEPENETAQHFFFKILEVLDPIGFYSRLLKVGTAPQKAHACKYLSDFSAESEIKNIEKHLNSKNQDLSYYAALALSKLGDEEGVSKFLIDCKDNYQLSHRLVLQLIGEYNKDIKSLANLVFRECDDYIKATVIKSLSKYNFYDFENIYRDALKSQNASLRVAAVTALGSFEDVKFEKQLIIASNDKMWIVRNAAVKALGRLDTENALKNVVRATSDVEWWVRNNAANALIKMDNGLEKAEQILASFDTYASDAVKNALYRSLEN